MILRRLGRWRLSPVLLSDVAVTVLAVVAALYVRLGESGVAARLDLLWVILPAFAALAAAVFVVIKPYRTPWRFVSLVDVFDIVKGATVLALALLVLDYVILAPGLYGDFFFGKITIVLFWLIDVFFLAAPRFTVRYLTEAGTRQSGAIHHGATLVVGSPPEAVDFLRSAEGGVFGPVTVVGVLSLNSGDIGRSLRGVPVVGVAEELEAIVTRFETRSVRVSRLVLLPSSLQKGAHPEHVLIRARRIGVVVHRIENVRDGGPLRMAPIAVEDLLLRDRVSVDHQLIQSAIRGKSVVVTGGGGSIGAELCRRAVDLEARRLLILESSELALQTVLDELTARQPPCAVEGRVADVRDRGRIQELFAEFHPDIVFHAAALKHVPVLETNAGEAVKTNVFGAMHVADAAVAAGARAFVQISTDKAVAPVSVLGATKRLAEMYCQALDANVRKSGGATRLLAVRFGNVLGSSGSVVPKFQAQIAEGGPVTVTHPEIVRYFMTIAEACDLVIASTAHALSDGASGVSIYALNMGRQIKIAELAERMIRLSGFEPGAGIEIVYVGMRPGERLNEILFADDEQRVDVGIPGIVGTAPAFADLDEIRGRIAALQDGAADRDAIFTALGGASVARRSGQA